METKPSLNVLIKQLHTDLITEDPQKCTMLYEIILKCKEEMENKCLSKPLEDYVERVAHYTNIPINVINQFILKDVGEINHKENYFKLDDRITIFRHLGNMYNTKTSPTYHNLLALCKNIKMNYSQFQYNMRCLQIYYHKVDSGISGQDILVEDPDLTFERYLYLKQIRNFRSQCAPIYYVSEIFFDETYSFIKPWIKDIDVSSQECTGYVFFHAISQEGFLNGLFCSPATKKDFIKWITTILIPQLMGPSVIVMDKNDLHGSTINSITKYHSKEDMLQYLMQKNIPCNENLHKAELYRLISKCSVDNTSNDVDEILKAHGHHVLRLPTTLHDLSMTHFLWEHILDLQPTLLQNIELHHIKNVLLQKLTGIPQNLWDNFHDKLIATENEISNIDSNISKGLEANYKIIV